MLRYLLLTLALLIPLSASAQTVANVEFPPGDYGTMVSGKVSGHEYLDYRLGARAGQKMFAELTVAGSNGNGTVYFNILPPGSKDVAIYNSSIDGNSTIITLPKSGTYTIRVYQMGNDKDAGKTSRFNVDLSIQ